MTETATYKELHRSRSDRMLAGVCGGLGEYFNVNPVFYRVGFVILTLLGGAGILVYGACALVIPATGERDSIASDVLRNHRQRPVAVLGLLLVVAAGVALLSHISLHLHSNAFWALVLIVGAGLIWVQRRPREAQAVPAVTTADPDAPTAVAPPARRRRRNPFAVLAVVIGFFALAVVIVFAIVVALFAHLSDGVGGRQYEPVTLSSLRPEYKVGVGNLQLDLSHLQLGAAQTTVHLKGGIGHIRVIVPSNTTVRVLGSVSWGDITALGHDENGHNVNTDVGSNAARLVIDAHLGIGKIEIDRA